MFSNVRNQAKQKWLLKMAQPSKVETIEQLG